MAIRELSFEEDEFVSGGLNSELVASGATTVAVGAVAVAVATIALPATGLALAAVGTTMAVGTIAVAAGGIAIAAGVGDLSSRAAARSSCFTSAPSSPQEACGRIIDIIGEPLSDSGAVATRKLYGSFQKR
jgi:hypothetical protein